MIKYPILEKNMTIGVTAPSSGIPENLYSLLYTSKVSMERKGYNVIIGETAKKQNKVRSDKASVRADEFNFMMTNSEIDIVIPPWGGELAIEILEYIDFENIQTKWILGYSDISLLLLVITLKTGIATAHGVNLVDLRGEYSDDVSNMWESVLSTKVGESVIQHSSKMYQKEWSHDASPYVFNFTDNTKWQAVGDKSITLKGRLLGGCIDVIRHIIGTPYGDVNNFRTQFINNEPIIWYLENCELAMPDLKRSLVQMKYAGWFDNCSGIVFGRSAMDNDQDDYCYKDVYAELSEELNLPIIYSVDCGHVPPQITFINGAYAEISYKDGSGSVVQKFI